MWSLMIGIQCSSLVVVMYIVELGAGDDKCHNTITGKGLYSTCLICQIGALCDL